MNVNKKGEQINFKRSIEIRNGIPIRSTDNLYRMTNAITLNYYIVSVNFYILISFVTNFIFNRAYSEYFGSCTTF